MRYFFHIAYKGTAYHGWQRQINVRSVQEVLEEKIQVILKRPITCIGCGRTDTGVHARQYFFHLDAEEVWPSDFLFVLNKNLPNDISVFEIIPVEGWPHAQFDANERTYTYHIHTQKNPFLSEVSSLYLLKELDMERIKKALSLLLQYQDFYAFCKTPDRHRSTLCQMTKAEVWSNKAQSQLRFQLTANRFLRGMVRIIVHQLLEVGQGRMSVETFESCLKNRERPAQLPLAFPQGLYLSRVKYPFLELPEQRGFESF